MRYYKVVIDGGSTYTSFTGGQTDPAALNIEMDVQVAPFHTVVGNSYLRIWGVPLTEIAQAKDLYLKGVTVYGGMQAGLPLATPAQNGLLFQGKVFQGFGNWQGLDQTLEMILIASPDTQAKPGNFAFNWKKGTPLKTALANTLNLAFPGFQQTININPKLVFTEDVPGFYQTPTQFGQFVNQLSKSVIGGATYNGVAITQKQNSLTVADGSTQTNPKQINFNDLIGQPSWIGPQQLNIKVVMRADISVGDYVKLPPGQIATSAQSLSQFRQGSVFQGVFLVATARHVGNFRQPNGDAWCTTYTLAGPFSQSAANG